MVRERVEEETTRSHAAEVIGRYQELLGSRDPHFEKKGERLIRRYDAEIERRNRTGDSNAPFFDLKTIETFYEGSDRAEAVLVPPMCA